MTRKQKLKLIKELEERIGNLRSHIYYGYDLKIQSENVSKIKLLAIKLHDKALTEEIVNQNHDKRNRGN